MALINCKECAGKVSTKAKACPNCGAKQPRRASLLGIILLFSILAVVMTAALQGDGKTDSQRQTEYRQAAKQSLDFDAGKINSKMLMECPTLDAECIQPYIFQAAYHPCSAAIANLRPGSMFIRDIPTQRFESAGAYSEGHIILHGRAWPGAENPVRWQYFCVYDAWNKAVIKADFL